MLQMASWSDPCEPDPCENGATCHSMEQDFYCACPEGYEGKTCEQLRGSCQSAPCQGEGLDPAPRGPPAPPPFHPLTSDLVAPQRSTAAPLPWRPTTRPECGASPPTCAARGGAASARPAPTSPACATPASAASTATKVRPLPAPPGTSRPFWDRLTPLVLGSLQMSTTAWATPAGTGAPASTASTPSSASAPAAGRGASATSVSPSSLQAPPPPPCLTSAPLSFPRCRRMQTPAV